VSAIVLVYRATSWEDLHVPISVNCPSCGKRLQAPDSAAGKRAQCPDCQTVMQLPEAVHNAEPVDDGYGVAGESGQSGSFLDDLNQAVSSPAPPTPYQSSGAPSHAQGSAGRRACPACGEMIVVGAAKCRFCGEIFDPTLRRREERRSSRYRNEDDENLTVVEWVVAILCSGIGCIWGIILMVQGKPKGGKMVGVSVLFMIIWTAIRLAIEAAAR